MKKELFAGVLLLVLIGLCAWNLRYLSRMCTQLDEAVAQAVRQLRQAYPKSSYNCMIQSQDQLVALCAAGREKTSPRIVEIYDEYGKGEKAHDHRVMRYRDVQDRDGKPSGVVVASSGFEQNESDGWKVLENDQMIVASNRTGEYHVRSI